MQEVIVTGAAGFIGYHVAERLLERGVAVLGVDSVNDYYDPSLKEARLRRLERYAGFEFARINLADRDSVNTLFARSHFDGIIHLAAQAGVRYSIQNPHAYVESNLVGFMNVLEGARQHRVAHLIYASSSSVYGSNTTLPFSIHSNVDHPVSLYAATKKANELMAHSYSHLYRLPTTGLRFFTVYGPWGRPDMAMFLFTKAILAGEPIDVFNHGEMWRDFTYIDDVVEGVVRVAERPATPNPTWSGATVDPGTSNAPYRVYNIGNNRPEHLLRLISVLEKHLGRPAVLRKLDMQPGDVAATAADVDDLQRDIGFRPSVGIEEGVGRFIEWYREYYASGAA